MLFVQNFNSWDYNKTLGECVQGTGFSSHTLAGIMSSFIIDYSWLHELVLYGRDAELSAAIIGNWDIIEAIWDLEEKYSLDDSSFFGGDNWVARFESGLDGGPLDVELLDEEDTSVMLELSVTGNDEETMEHALIDATETITWHFSDWGFEDIERTAVQ